VPLVKAKPHGLVFALWEKERGFAATGMAWALSSVRTRNPERPELLCESVLSCSLGAIYMSESLTGK
jgi:hypothetical protein